uniref:Type II secretion system protein J n=1 Tax=Candidatus Kentrum sp. MB TaxID=2138164 RepID=A0A450XRW0_9GAMM|nr:MAG: general secretion pathway protein J [Candidatus Kentron sp. MB]VFK32015.1 MAG: general secretion pathway protein J [Candidatus Kentron sp. MB]VFK75679.1 MAG: general secretion pathway protein J [Candidatus Kentron sp. MB]
MSVFGIQEVTLQEKYVPMSRSMAKKRRYSGMTLLELLIALAVFAVISAITYGAIHTATETQQRIKTRTTRFTALQKAMAVIERDILQIVDRPIRDEYGETLPALHAAHGDLRSVGFTRTSWQALTGLKRVRLRRVAYEFSDRRLLRLVWNVLDRAEDSLPLSSVLLTEVTAVEFRYLNTDNQWLSVWPPLEWEGASSGLPRAIEVSMEMREFGRFTRLLALPGMIG